MKTLSIIAGLLLTTSQAHAVCVGSGAFKSCFDPGTGNSYQVQQFGNTTQLRGANPNGSTWSQQSNRFGNTVQHNGVDSSGRTWSITDHQIGGTRLINGTDGAGNRVNCVQTKYFSTC